MILELNISTILRLELPGRPSFDNFAGMDNLTQNEYPEYSFMFKFEHDFNAQHAAQVITDLWYPILASACIYLVVIFGIQHWMSTREPFKLRWLLFAWNLVLAVFSIIGTLRFYPNVFHSITNFGLQYSICSYR